MIGASRKGCVVAMLLVACGSPELADAGGPDASAESDAGLEVDADTGSPDAAVVDAGAPDAGSGGPRLRCTEQGVVGATACTEADPCSPADSAEPLSSPSDVPRCARRFQPARTPLERVDPDGHRRYACVFDEHDGSEERPLVIFLHGGGGTADAVARNTNLIERSADFEMAPGVTGFRLLSLQARNLHYPLGRLNDGVHHDSSLWDAASNADLENLAYWIDRAVAEGGVDEERIYLMGWSEGGMLSVLAASALHREPTPMGNRPAAIAIFSATSPFDRALDETTRCSTPVPAIPVPIAAVSRSCDIVPCDEAQREALWAQDSFSDVISVERWVEQLDAVGADVTWRLIDADGQTVEGCQADCDAGDAFFNHITWPGEAEAVDHERWLLEQLSAHMLTGA